jgi:hypothetical protein
MVFCVRLWKDADVSEERIDLIFRMEVEAVYSSETSISKHKNARYHNPKHHNLNKTYILDFLLSCSSFFYYSFAFFFAPSLFATCGVG